MPRGKSATSTTKDVTSDARTTRKFARVMYVADVYQDSIVAEIKGPKDPSAMLGSLVKLLREEGRNVSTDNVASFSGSEIKYKTGSIVYIVRLIVERSQCPHCGASPTSPTKGCEICSEVVKFDAAKFAAAIK